MRLIYANTYTAVNPLRLAPSSRWCTSGSVRRLMHLRHHLAVDGAALAIRLRVQPPRPPDEAAEPRSGFEAGEAGRAAVEGDSTRGVHVAVEEQAGHRAGRRCPDIGKIERDSRRSALACPPHPFGPPLPRQPHQPPGFLPPLRGPQRPHRGGQRRPALLGPGRSAARGGLLAVFGGPGHYQSAPRESANSCASWAASAARTPAASIARQVPGQSAHSTSNPCQVNRHIGPRWGSAKANRSSGTVGRFLRPQAVRIVLLEAATAAPEQRDRLDVAAVVPVSWPFVVLQRVAASCAHMVSLQRAPADRGSRQRLDGDALPIPCCRAKRPRSRLPSRTDEAESHATNLRPAEAARLMHLAPPLHLPLPLR
jgi:hypothetical protein